MEPSDSPDGTVLGIAPMTRRRYSARKRVALMENVLRRWKCLLCSRANETAIELDGTATCKHCTRRINVQASRIKNGVVLPASYPTRMGASRQTVHVRSLGEV